MSRAPLATMLVLLTAALTGCGHSQNATSAEPWPITLQANVVDYAAARLTDPVRDEIAREIVGFAPAGLDAGRPLVLVGLDAKVFGGSNALLLPLRDESAFRASLDATPILHRGARDTWTLDIAADSLLGHLRLLASGIGSVRSVSDVLRSLQEAGAQTAVFEVSVVDDWALVAPTFEAGSACREVLRETGGFASVPPNDLVVSGDIARLRVVYAEELQRLEDEFKAAIGGAQAAGLVSMAAAMHNGGEGVQLPFGLHWEPVWALKEMFPLAMLEGVQVRVPTLGHGPVPSGAIEHPDGVAVSPQDLTEEDHSLWSWMLSTPAVTLRLRATPGMPLAEFVAALRPAPDVPDARLVLAADGPAFGRAVSHWIRPLGRLVTGDGPPCDRYLDELATLLASAGGVFAVVEVDHRPCLLATAGTAPPDLLPRLQAWTSKLLTATGASDDGGAPLQLTAQDLPDGRTLLVGADGAPRLTLGRRGDVFWLCSGAEPAEEPAAALLAFERALSAPPPADAPAVRCRFGSAQIEVRAADRELQLDLRRIDDGH